MRSAETVMRSAGPANAGITAASTIKGLNRLMLTIID